ncbi:MAG: SAM-dependent methyltransferase [Armatimonadetes bacterium]|nr:SAM-dependent methyltransferase [Armatimonadota bacterium]
MPHIDADNYESALRESLGEHGFLRMTFSSKRDEAVLWNKVVLRPVEVKGCRVIQFSYFDGRQDIARNASGEEAAARLEDLLTTPFGQVHLQTTAGDTYIKITRKGKALVSQAKPSLRAEPLLLAHDRWKERPLPAGSPDPFLEAIGILDAQGQVRPSMQGKFRQINEFLRIVRQVVPEPDPARLPLSLIDCGCGSAYLTFAAYHYLKNKLGRAVHVVGIDRNPRLIARCLSLRDGLGWDGLEFHTSAIVHYEPATPPQITLSLHACDTATDEAIAQGVRWESRAILSAPCCQHELHNRIQAPLFQPLLRHGILRERLADLLTDAFRAQALRIMGYRADVIEFVSPEHTSKNLMIRAERGAEPGRPDAVQEYRALKDYWQVSPAIEGLLGEAFLKQTKAF